MSRLGMFVKMAAFAASVSLLPGGVLAQDVCAPALSAALKDTMTKHGVYYLADRLKWDYEGVSYSSLSDRQKQEFGLVYDQLDLDFTSDQASTEEKFNAFTQKYQTRTDRYSSESISVSNIKDKQIEEWGKCIQYTQSDLFIAFDPAGTRKHVTVQIRYTGAVPIEFQGVETYNMSCSHNGAPVLPETRMQLHTQMITLNCSRNMAIYEMGGLTSEYYPDASVTVKTIEGSSRYEFVSMIDGPAKTKFEAVDRSIVDVSVDARERIGVVQTQLDRMKAALGSWPSEVSKGPTMGANVSGHGGTSLCPNGTYMVGMSYVGARGAHCDGCVATFTPICRALNR